VLASAVIVLAFPGGARAGWLQLPSAESATAIDALGGVVVWAEGQQIVVWRDGRERRTAPVVQAGPHLQLALGIDAHGRIGATFTACDDCAPRVLDTATMRIRRFSFPVGSQCSPGPAVVWRRQVVFERICSGRRHRAIMIRNGRRRARLVEPLYSAVFALDAYRSTVAALTGAPAFGPNIWLFDVRHGCSTVIAESSQNDSGAQVDALNPKIDAHGVTWVENTSGPDANLTFMDFTSRVVEVIPTATCRAYVPHHTILDVFAAGMPKATSAARDGSTIYVTLQAAGVWAVTA
jgi:hypothetical protein